MSASTESVLPPARRVSQLVLGLWVSQAVHAAAELGLADALAPAPLPAAELAARLGTHPDATARLLQALAVVGLVERRAGAWALSELGRCLASDAPDSVRAWCRLMGSPGVWGAWGRLVDCVRTGRPGYGEGGEGPFEQMERDSDGAEVFHQAMVDLTRGVAPGIVAAVDLGGARRVVDLGGGHGALLCAALEAHPHLTGAVFDLAHAREGAQRLLASRRLSGRADFVEGNLFEEAPPPADVYLLKSVLHDWDDARSLRILERCREAMQPGARLLVVEPCASGPSAAPEWIVAFSDLNMLVNTGGRERTEGEYRQLLESARLKVLGVHTTQSLYRVFEVVRP